MGSCSRTPRARSPAAASTSGRSNRQAGSRAGSPPAPPSRSCRHSSGTARSRSARSSRASLSRRRRATRATPAVGPREPLPDLDQRAPFRLADHRHEARLRLRDRQRRRRAGVGARQPPAPVGAMRAEQLVRMSDGTVRTYPDAGRLRYTPRPPTRTGTCSTSSATSFRTLEGELIVRDRKSGFCLADHYGPPSGGSPPLRALTSTATAPPPTPARSLSSRAPRSGSRTSTPPTSTARTSTSGRARRYLPAHPSANPTLQLEELDYTNNDASLRIQLTWQGGSPASRRYAAARTQRTARPKRGRKREEIGQPVGLSRRRPSRSSRNAFIPSARAPSMSSS